jgi:hypothetical protein
MVRLNFGKHKGKLVGDVPTSYLFWAWTTCENLDYFTRQAIAQELRSRGCDTGYGSARGESSRQANAQAGARSGAMIDLRAVLADWFRQMSRRWHPDTGGSDEAMMAVVDGHDRLRRLLNL